MATSSISLKQIRLIPSGCQKWSKRVVDSLGGKFAYCSTLAVYVFSLHTYRLERLIAAHERTISALSWCPSDPNHFVTSGHDRAVRKWNVSEEKEENSVVTKMTPLMVDWCPHEHNLIAILLDGGTVQLWNSMGISSNKDRLSTCSGLKSGMRCIKWNHGAKGGAPVLAAGGENGSIYLYNVHKKKTTRIQPTAEDREQVITDVQWDPLSNVYLLAVGMGGQITLFDTETSEVRMEFEDQPTEITGLVWVPHIPGGFYTVNKRAPVISLWNVSQRTPVKLIKVGKKSCGITAIAPIPHTKRFIIGMRDGSVVVFDGETERQLFSTEPGHSETIFDCRLKPNDSNVLATASYDGSVRVWNTVDMKNDIALGQEGIVYGLSWAPGNDSRLASCSAKGEVVIWDTNTGECLHVINNHTEASFRVAWNPGNVHQIASTGDTTCVIFSPSGKIFRKYKHPASVYGCDWSPFDRHVLCTGCRDGHVRVWNVNDPDTSPKHVLKGHKRRVFNTVWSPLVENMLASGSDDHTIRVWNVSTGSSMELTGHVNKVRALQWSYEVPFLLLSGSWDGTIRMWDVRNGGCIDVIYDHYADVYGLTSHPMSPFTFVSSSRDTSLRFWSCESIGSSVKLQAMLNGGRLHAKMTGISDIASTMAPAAPAALCGAGSQELIRAQFADEWEAFSALFKFFSAAPGIAEATHLVNALLSKDSSSSNLSVVHINDVHHAQRSRAKGLEVTQGLGRGRKAAQLQEAADTYLKLGLLREYCELTTQLGQWERALAMAPAVSFAYWRELTQRYTAHMSGSVDPALPAFLLALGAADKLVNYHLAANNVEDALVVAVTHARGALPPEQEVKTPAAGHDDVKEDHKAVTVTPLVRAVMQHRAKKYFAEAKPVLAACCYLAVNDPQHAVQILVQGHEIELALAIAQTLRIPFIGHVHKLFARKLESQGLWTDALKVLRGLSNHQVEVLELAGRAPKSVGLHNLAGIRSPEALEAQADLMATETDHATIVECVRYYVAAHAHVKAVTVGVAAMKAILSRPCWNLKDVEEIITPLYSVHAEKLPQNLKIALLAYAAFVGAQLACARCYTPIVPHLFETVRSLDFSGKLNFPVPADVMQLMLISYLANFEPSRANGLARILLQSGATLSPVVKAGIQAVQKRIATGHYQSPPPRRPDNTISHTGADLPSAARKRFHYVSVVSKLPVSGPRVFLENHSSVMALSEALMWAQVDPFSPLNSGQKIDPFAS